MIEKDKLLKTPEYWFEELQNEIFRQVSEYMQKNKLNQVGLAKKLGVSKGYISQILNGNANFSLKKLVELSLAIDKVPTIKYTVLAQRDKSEKSINRFNKRVSGSKPSGPVQKV